MLAQFNLCRRRPQHPAQGLFMYYARNSLNLCWKFQQILLKIEICHLGLLPNYGSVALQTSPDGWVWKDHSNWAEFPKVSHFLRTILRARGLITQLPLVPPTFLHQNWPASGQLASVCLSHQPLPRMLACPVLEPGGAGKASCCLPCVA